MGSGELLFAGLTILAFGLYSAVLLWLTLSYHDHQKLLTGDK